MDTLDNANATNPFVNSNNGDIKQKEDYVMNIGDGFKQNGTETVEFLRATNGKRTSHEFDEDDDLGPETDVDTIDDVLLSSTVLSAKNLMEEIVNNNALCEKEKATLETDTDLIEKQNADEFEDMQPMREETPTPPADLVQDTSGCLLDNVAESGEESEDEWNYIKGDQAEKTHTDPLQSDKEICELTSDLDNMSQLNPNAAEFVPISPKRTMNSLSYDAIVDDSIVAQSPRRGSNNDYDINVPNPKEFEREIKSRPSELHETNAAECVPTSPKRTYDTIVDDSILAQSPRRGSNNDYDINVPNPKEFEIEIKSRPSDECDLSVTLTTQEVMENLLNGKSIEEIEFQPNTTPVKFANAGEFHFGPNSTPFATPGGLMDQSEVLSTKAVFGDDSNYLEDKQLDDLSYLNESQWSTKDKDPMSTSFYQDKEDAVNNPFDLNKVQVLPENIDEFLEKPKEDEPNLLVDIPHNPWEDENRTKSPVLQDEREIVLDAVVTDNQRLESPAQSYLSEDSRSPNVESPITDGLESGVAGLIPLVPEVQFALSHNRTPSLEALSPEPVVTSTPEPTIEPSPRFPSPVLDVDEEKQQTLIADETEQKLETPVLNVQLDDLARESLIFVSQSPVPDLLSSSNAEQEEKAQSPLTIEEPHISSPLPEVNFEEELCARSPLLDTQSTNTNNETVIEAATYEIIHSPKPPVDLPLFPTESTSPQVGSPLSPGGSLVFQSAPVPTMQELDSSIDDITSSVKDSPVLVASPLEKPESPLCPTTGEDAFIDPETESVATADVNSFLERSLIPDITSPLSVNDTPFIGVCNTGLDVDLSKIEENSNESVVVAVTSPIVPATVMPAAVAEKKSTTKPKSTLSVKKLQPKPTTTATTKPLTKAPASKPAASKSATSTATKVLQSKSPTTTSKMLSSVASKITPKEKIPINKVSSTVTSKIAPKEKTPINKVPSSVASKTTPKERTSITSKVAEKKPLVNGDASKPLPKKIGSSTTVPRQPITKSALAKDSPSNLTTKRSPASSTTARTTTPKDSAAKTTSVPAKTATSKPVTSTYTSKPRTTVPTSKPKSLAPDTKKQIKETTNKQITSSTTSNKPLSATGRNTTVKSSTLTKTTSNKVEKPPAELIVRHGATKPKTTGIVNRQKVSQTELHQKKPQPPLIKDVSPVVENIIDNSQVLEMNNVAD